jgi:hypothetical protein
MWLGDSDSLGRTSVAGFEVDPSVLGAGAPKIYGAADLVGEAAGLLNGAQINAQALGDVSAAEDFAAAFGAFAGSHGADLAHGSIWVDDAARGLTQGADSYRQAEEQSTVDVRKAGRS